MATRETGIQFLARLGSRPSLTGFKPVLFGSKGPQAKDVIEIFGGEGTGKTEMLIHLIVQCILPESWRNIPLHGRQAGVIFIDTDLKFSILNLASRLEKYVLEKASVCLNRDKIEDVELELFIKDCLRRLHIVRCWDSSHLLLTLHNLENIICNEANISAIMIDSISAFYWIDKFNSGDSSTQEEVRMKQATEILSKLVNSYNLVLFAAKAAVFKKKEQTDFVDELEDGVLDAKGNPRDLELIHAEFMCRPWQRLVSHRLVLVKDEKSGNQSFIVGGDCVHGNTRFKCSTSGIEFI